MQCFRRIFKFPSWIIWCSNSEFRTIEVSCQHFFLDSADVVFITFFHMYFIWTQFCVQALCNQWSSWRFRLHQCWWRMLETKCGDGHHLLTLASGPNIQKMSPISKFRHQRPKVVINIESPTSSLWWGSDGKEETGRQWQLEWIKQYNTYKYWNRAKTFEQYGY